MKKKLLIFNEFTLFSGFILPADFTENMKILEKLSENGIRLALVSSTNEKALLKTARKRGVDINHMFNKISYTHRAHALEDYLGYIINWGKSKRLKLDEMVYFGYSLHPDYSATIAGECIDFIGVLVNPNVDDPFAGRASMTADQKTESSKLWQFLPKYLELTQV